MGTLVLADNGLTSGRGILESTRLFDRAKLADRETGQPIYFDAQGVDQYYGLSRKVVLTAAVAITFMSLPAHSTAPTDDERMIGSVHGARLPKERIVIDERFSALAAELASYSDVTDGWDGPDTIAPGPLAIANAMNFLSRVPGQTVAPDLMVADDGSVGWFWRTSNVTASISFYANGRFGFYGETTAGKTLKASGNFAERFDLSEMIALVASS